MKHLLDIQRVLQDDSIIPVNTTHHMTVTMPQIQLARTITTAERQGPVPFVNFLTKLEGAIAMQVYSHLHYLQREPAGPNLTHPNYYKPKK